MLTTDELRAQLSHDAAEIPTNAGRLDQVHGRVSKRRRHRAQLTGALAVVAIGAAVVVLPQVLPGSSDDVPTIPAVSPNGSTPLAEYRAGGHLIAQTEARGPEGVDLVFTPSNKHLMFVIDCYLPGIPAKTMVDISIDGEPVSATSCGQEPTFGGASSFTPPTLDGLTPGKASVLTLTYPAGASPLSQARVGIYEAVPVADYPFPPAPDPLPAVDPYANLIPSEQQSPVAVCSAGPLKGVQDVVQVGAAGTCTIRTRIRHGLTISAQTSAPGTLHFIADGRELDTSSSWSYDQALYENTLTLKDLGIKSGDFVTIKVTSERFPGDSWAVLLSDRAA